MSRILPAFSQVPFGRTLLAGEPLVFHCNYYNYFLQKTLLLDETLGMDDVIRDAAASVAHTALSAAVRELGAGTPELRAKVASDLFAGLGFGTLDLSGVVRGEGQARLPVSHYGACLRQASGADFAAAQSHFDAGYVAAAAAVIAERDPSTWDGRILACQSMGAPEGRIELTQRRRPWPGPSCGVGAHHSDAVVPAPFASHVDEAYVLAALATLDFSGNEEGLIPRFGVMLTNHFANFYNRISFEFVARMRETGLLEAGELLLVEAGHRCAFHTFGGIMESAEWDAVVRPQCRTWEDWVAGIVACVNALGWGVWRIHELGPDRLVVRIWDDYESTGYLGMYGRADRPVSYLAAGGIAGMMNLVRVGDIQDKPTLDDAFYARVFESAHSFSSEQTRSMAMGDPYTEVVAKR
jgi:hypothetical protein